MTELYAQHSLSYIFVPWRIMQLSTQCCSDRCKKGADWCPLCSAGGVITTPYHKVYTKKEPRQGVCNPSTNGKLESLDQQPQNLPFFQARNPWLFVRPRRGFQELLEHVLMKPLKYGEQRKLLRKNVNSKLCLNITFLCVICQSTKFILALNPNSVTNNALK